MKIEFNQKRLYVFSFRGKMFSVITGTACNGEHKGEVSIIEINKKSPTMYTPGFLALINAELPKHIAVKYRY